MRKGFTLSELLIALAILGVIATFTIPKVLQSQQDGRYNAIAKETAGMIAEAYQIYNSKQGASASTKSVDILPYLNYVSYATSGTMDEWQTGNVYTCTATSPCITMHNGSKFNFDESQFGGTATTNAIWFMVDPDGKVTDGTTNGPGKSTVFVLYFNGALRTWGTAFTGTMTNGSSFGPLPARDPPWFSWN